MAGGRSLSGTDRKRENKAIISQCLPSSPLSSAAPITGSSACHQYAVGPLLSSTRRRPLNTLPPLWGSGLRGTVPPNPLDNLGFLLLPGRAENK